MIHDCQGLIFCRGLANELSFRSDTTTVDSLFSPMFLLVVELLPLFLGDKASKLDRTMMQRCCLKLTAVPPSGAW